MYRIVFLLSLSLFSCKEKATRELPFYNTPDFTPHFLTEQEANSKISHKIADFSFRDQQNKLVTEQNIEDKIHVACFFFTCCGSICPKIMNNFRVADSVFKNEEDVLLLSYTVTPWLDSVARLKKYSEVQHVGGPKWHLLTGDKASLYKLARQSYFAEEDLGYSKDSTEFLHTEHILLIDRDRRIRGIYNGTLELEGIQLVKDIKTLLRE